MHPREKLLAAAQAAETRQAGGEARPLEGIPLGVKDLWDAVGLEPSFGRVPRGPFAYWEFERERPWHPHWPIT